MHLGSSWDAGRKSAREASIVTSFSKSDRETNRKKYRQQELHLGSSWDARRKAPRKTSMVSSFSKTDRQIDRQTDRKTVQ